MKRSFGSKEAAAASKNKKQHVDDEVSSGDEIVETQQAVVDLFEQKRTSLLEVYKPILLSSTPTGRSYELGILEQTCCNYLSILGWFDKDKVRFHTSENKNKMGVEITSINYNPNTFKAHAEKIIPVITNENIKFNVVTQSNVDQQSKAMSILELEFDHPLTKEEFQKIFGRLAFIHHLIKDGIINKKQVANFVVNLRRGEDIVLKLINHLVSLKDFNKLQLLDEALPETIRQQLSEEYSSQALQGFERLVPFKRAISKFINSSSKTTYLQNFFRVFSEEITFQRGRGPNEINISTEFYYKNKNISRSYTLKPNFYRGVMQVFSMLNPDANEFQFKCLDNISVDQDPSTIMRVLVLKYPEKFSLMDLQRMLTRSMWLRKIGAKPLGCGQSHASSIIECINDLAEGDNLVTNIEMKLNLPLHQRFSQFPLININEAVNDQLLSTSAAAPPQVEQQNNNEAIFFLPLGGFEAVQQLGLFPAVDDTQRENDLFFDTQAGDAFLRSISSVFGPGGDNA